MTEGSPPDLQRLRIDRSRGGSGGGGGGGGAGGSCAVWLVVLLLALSFAAYVAWKEGWLGEVPGLARDSRPLVRLGTVVRRDELVARSGVSANGYVVARQRAALSTDIQGRIVELTVEEGDRVTEGQLIARLDTRQLEASLARARGELARWQASLTLAEREYARIAALVGSGDAQVAQRDAREAGRDELAASIAAQRATIREIEVMIDKSSVYAPFSGVIVDKNAEIGEVVAALGAGGPAAGGAVATLVDFETLEVQIELAQSALSAARVGAPVTLYLDAYPRDGYPGRVRQIWPTANRTKATVEVRVEFLERDDRILPEMGVRAVFTDEALVDAADEAQVLVPGRALQGEGPRRSVFVFDRASGRLERVEVELAGEVDGPQAAVADGLDGGERVVLDPGPELTDGLAVRLTEEG